MMGKLFPVWDKANGAKLDTIVVNKSYKGGQAETHEGIAVDACNNIYVAGTDTVHVFNFDGTDLLRINSITANIIGEVYDITLDNAKKILYVSGNNFVTTGHSYFCKTTPFNVNSLIDTCNGIIKLTASNGVLPYKFNWSNGSTTDGIIVPSGLYSVTVSDNACIQRFIIDSFAIYKDSTSLHFAVKPSLSKICPGDSVLSSLPAQISSCLPPPILPIPGLLLQV